VKSERGLLGAFVSFRRCVGISMFYVISVEEDFKASKLLKDNDMNMFG
jgi:hypothetical protein